jgi:hypothetical protein
MKGMPETAVRQIDVFNGDADGLCALRQLRLAERRGGELVTGVKRDIRLLEKVTASRGDRVTVLDISLDQNRAALERLLAAGAQVRYFDHHYAGAIPQCPNLDAHIDTGADVCTSLLVDRHLQGSQRPWAVVACFGDGLVETGYELAAVAGITGSAADALRELGECLNYNAYGEREEDLCFAPARLYGILEGYADPREFIAAEPAFQVLRKRLADDTGSGLACSPSATSAARAVYVLPDTGWSRRVGGILANHLVQRDPARAYAVLYPNSKRGYTISVRAPGASRKGAADLCRKFPTGGGREAAAGINHLPLDGVDAFLSAFADAFPDRG